MNDDRNDRSENHSNDRLSGHLSDAEIAGLFESDATPPRKPDYWERIQTTLAAVDAAETADRAIEKSPENPDTDGPALRPSTMQTIQEQTTRSDEAVRSIDSARSAGRQATTRGRILLAAAVLLIGGGIGFGALSAIDRSSPTETTTDPVGTVESVDESTAEAAGGTDPTVPLPLVNQAESDLRFDFGAMARIDEIDGVWWVWFDRYSVDGASGTQLTEPFSTALISDAAPIANVNPGLRTYRLADDATVELIDPAAYEAICGGEIGPDEAFFTSSLDDLPSNLSRVSPYWWDGTMLASLTFNDAGEVSLISDSRGC